MMHNIPRRNTLGLRRAAGHCDTSRHRRYVTLSGLMLRQNYLNYRLTHSSILSLLSFFRMTCLCLYSNSSHSHRPVIHRQIVKLRACIRSIALTSHRLNAVWFVTAGANSVHRSSAFVTGKTLVPTVN